MEKGVCLSTACFLFSFLYNKCNLKMSLGAIISISQIFISVVLVVSVLLQQRGSSLGSSFGGTGTTYHTKRGFEKILFNSTIIFGILFVASTIATLVIK